MNAKELNVVNRLLIAESKGFDEVSHLTIKGISERTGIPDLSAISRHLQKIADLNKIEIIKQENKNNIYRILDRVPIPETYTENVSDKQKGLMRHFAYQYGFDVWRKVCKKLNLPLYIEKMNCEQASNFISFYYKNNKLICDSAENWKQSIKCFPLNYEIKNYQHLLDNDIEKNIVVPLSLFDKFTNNYSCAPISKDTLCAHFTIYYLSHFDLILLGFEHKVYNGKDYYMFNSKTSVEL